MSRPLIERPSGSGPDSVSWTVIGDTADTVITDGDVVTGVLIERIEQNSAADLGNQLGGHLLGCLAIVANVAGDDRVGRHVARDDRARGHQLAAVVQHHRHVAAEQEVDEGLHRRQLRQVPELGIVGSRDGHHVGAVEEHHLAAPAAREPAGELVVHLEAAAELVRAHRRAVAAETVEAVDEVEGIRDREEPGDGEYQAGEAAQPSPPGGGAAAEPTTAAVGSPTARPPR